MSTLIIDATLAIVFVVSLNILIVAAKTAPRRRHTMQRMPLVVFILGAIVFSSACSTSPKGTNAKQYNSKQYNTKQYNARKPVGYVKRAIFTTGIKDREPTNNIQKLPNNNQKIYYFTEIRSMQGQSVKHRWVYKGKIMAEVEFKVKGPRWRVYSSKRLESGWLGNWTVMTVDRNGTVLSKKSFSYTQATGFSANKKLSKAPNEESYLDIGARKASEFYEGMFGEN